MITLIFDDRARATAERLIDLALAEDLNTVGDLTSTVLIGQSIDGEVELVARQSGIVAGMPVAEMVFQLLDKSVQWSPQVPDGTAVRPGNVLATLTGSMRSLLTGERTALNFLTHLSGIATLTRRFVDAVAGTKGRVLDTRKTLPGWRALEKYAVRAGGGANHRMGLNDGILIKDNHLAAWSQSRPDRSRSDGSIAAAVRAARRDAPAGITIEAEVDSLDQLVDALAGKPDIILLDNMSCEMLREAVALRNQKHRDVQLEASGSVTLDTIQQIAQTGVERISVGALTHSAVALDMAFDWKRLTA